ncbi:MAG TPA: HAMP domain-containing sensor histidine kinase [Candidatus Dormibacteraeota bacterium]|nr:HAMP domain-containing sensor histidine kinase [Candidatus Dormibacteraeota bacterium]
MRAQSLTSRVLRGTVFVTLVTALAGAATAALLARSLWQAHERRALLDLAAGLAQAVEREAVEEERTPDSAASDALRESVTSGYRAEVWRGPVLVAASPPGPSVGPPDESKHATQDAWLIETRPLRGGLLLVVASPRQWGEEALRIFGWSLLLSAPVCVVVAVLIGRLVGRRVTRPLLDFRDRIGAARPFDPLPPAAPPEVLEVAELEASFRRLWERLQETVSRELEFAANASHELRTPLTRIRLHAERARVALGAAAGGASSEELRVLVEEIDRLVRLVDSLLVLSRDAAAGIPAGEVVNVSDLVAAASRRVFAGASLPEIEAPDEALVRGDEALLGIAVENLLDNARKFSLPGRPPRVAVGEDGASVRVTVTSPGARITGDLGERLFERFYRGPEARASHAGHGLGLPLARHVARLHGGDVRPVSAPGEDARFELALPAWRSL